VRDLSSQPAKLDGVEVPVDLIKRVVPAQARPHRDQRSDGLGIQRLREGMQQALTKFLGGWSADDYPQLSEHLAHLSR
jgi:hypothetical protein